MKKALFFLTLTVVFSFLGCSSQTGTDEVEPSYFGVVQTQYGRVSGTFENNVTHYRGIPYAKPPVGDLRWKAPEDPDPWTTTLVCEYYKPMAPQVWHKTYWWADEFYYEEDIYKKTFAELTRSGTGNRLTGNNPLMSEDCLYLNVVTPATSAGSNLPVFIWFHGGANANGYTFEPEFEPSKLAAKGVVVVTVAFRLGPFGYLALPQLSAESPSGTSGNYGLLDQIKSIKWVKDNITAFGGNPDNITIGGQSAGASAVRDIIASPLARDSSGKRLIQRAIMDSSFGALGTLRTQAAAYTRGQTYLASYNAKGLDLGNMTLAQLRALPMSTYFDIDPVTERDWVASGFGIYLDNYTATQEPRDYFLTPGNLSDLTLIFGNNDGESTSNGLTAPPAGYRATFFNSLNNTYGEYLPSGLTFEGLLNIQAGDDVSAYFENMRLSAQRTGTQHLIIGEVLSKLNPDAQLYPYFFSHWTPGRQAEQHWAWHSGELWYFFNSMRTGHPTRVWQRIDYDVGDWASSYWANFMRTGDPNGSGLPAWPKASEGKLMDLGNNNATGSVENVFVAKQGINEGTKKAPMDEMMRKAIIASQNLASYY